MNHRARIFLNATWRGRASRVGDVQRFGRRWTDGFQRFFMKAVQGLMPAKNAGLGEEIAEVLARAEGFCGGGWSGRFGAEARAGVELWG